MKVRKLAGIFTNNLEFDVYKRALNGVLPNEIRVVEAAPVEDSFCARFNCQYREYFYFFQLNGMDINKMRTACSYLEGEHDFRNFCKLNVLATTNYVRTLHTVAIEKNDDIRVDVFDNDNSSPNPFESYYLRIRGNAFLYHMIRCIVTVLFKIGKGEDPPESINRLLDIENQPRRPGYAFASPYPLVLSNCAFDPDPFSKVADSTNYISSRDPSGVYNRRINELMTELAVVSFMLRKRAPEKAKLIIFDDQKNGSIFNNSECFSVEETIENLKGKKKQKFEEIIDWKKDKGIECDELGISLPSRKGIEPVSE